MSRLTSIVIAAALVAACGSSSEPGPPVREFAYTCATTTLDVCVIGENGTVKRTLVENASSDEMPDWSPNGQQLVFVSRRNAGVATLWTANADGTNQVMLAPNLVSSFPRWSPDGSRIAYVRIGLHIINADGTNPVQIVDDTLRVDRASWSPDGQRLAFGQIPGSGNTTMPGLWLTNRDGTGKIRLTTNPTDRVPSWSPDGLKLVFTNTTTGDAGIEVINIDGSGRQRLYTHPTASNPVWSRDGKHVAFTITSAPIRIWIMTASGDSVRQLQTGNVNGDSDPSWRP